MRRQLLLHHLGEYLRELSVLVTVFFPLDVFFGWRPDTAMSRGGWLLVAAAVSIVSFAMGHRCEGWAKEAEQ